MFVFMTSLRFQVSQCFPWIARGAFFGAAVVLLVGCGGGGGGAAPIGTEGAYTVGGVVNGLTAGKALVLQNGGTDDLGVNSNGNFAFATRLNSGAAYAVTVKTQPDGQRCVVSQGAGTVTANVSGVVVHCEALPFATYTVGGVVSGLESGGVVVLQNNAGDDVSVGSNGGFTFPTPVVEGAGYSVAVKTQPSWQTCTVQSGAGTVSKNNVQAIQVNCDSLLAQLEGFWVEDLCLPMAWGTALTIARQGPSQVHVKQMGVIYEDGYCSGAFRTLTPSDMGNAVFTRVTSSGGLTAFWGAWPERNGNYDRAIWTRVGPYLCFLRDNPESPSTMAEVEARTAAGITSKACARRR